MTNNRAVIYCRVSTEEQKEGGFSLDNQSKRLREYVRKNSFETVEEIVTGESAKAEGRRDFGRMIKLVQSENIGNIVVWHTDRLSRNSDDQATIKKLIRKGVRIHLVGEGQVVTEADYDGKLFYMVKGAFAERFIDDLRKNTTDGMMEKASQGGLPGLAPIGYKNAPGESSKKRIVVQDPEKIGLVKWAFERYAKGGISLVALQGELDKKGLTNHNGGKVTKRGVETILKNDFYYGYFRWAGQLWKGTHEPAISKELFDEVQTRLRRNFKEPKQGKRFFPYKNFIKCGFCGASMVGEFHRGGHNSGEYFYYRCSKSKDPRCPQANFTQKEVEDILARGLDDLYVTDEVIARIKSELKRAGGEQASTAKNELRRLQGLLAKKTAQLDLVYRDRVNGDISVEQYKNWQAKIQDEVIGFEDEIHRLGRLNAKFKDQALQVVEIIRNFKKIYGAQDGRGKSEILGVVLDKCVVKGQRGEGSVFSFKAPFNYVFHFMKANRVLTKAQEGE